MPTAICSRASSRRSATSRTDAYGRDRLRFPLEVLDAVRRTGAESSPSALSVTDWARGGLSVEDGVAIARVLVEHGCDLVHTVAGQTIAEDRPEYRAGSSPRSATASEPGARADARRRVPDDAGRREHDRRRRPRRPLHPRSPPPTSRETDLDRRGGIESSAYFAVTDFAELAYPDVDALVADER